MKTREEEIEFDCTYHFKQGFKVTYKEEYLKDKDDIDTYYVDQAGTHSIYGDRALTSFFTWYGIKQMDSWYAKQIRLESDSKYTKEQLEGFIKTNPHLHNIIKTNLLLNLRTYKQS